MSPRLIHARLFPPLLCLLFPLPAAAQDFSYDGNRWYEIEISIFTNGSVNGQKSELTIPEKIHLSYPEDIRQLIPAGSSFRVPFEALNAPVSPDGGDPSIAPPAETLNGPLPRPGKSEFRVSDFRRDPYIALGDGNAEFGDYDDEIDASPEHRLLYHAVWRQPVMNRVQSTAIFVAGGDRYGAHTELEGSVRFSYDVNRVNLEARLWFIHFSGVSPDPRNRDGMTWHIPPVPFNADGDAGNGFTPVYEITDVGIMDQLRPMTSNTLHYLDHPDIGILVEIRPYQLPSPPGFELD